MFSGCIFSINTELTKSKKNNLGIEFQVYKKLEWRREKIILPEFEA